MNRVQAVSTILILSIACSMPAMVSGGTLGLWDSVWMDFQTYDPPCKAKKADDPNFLLAIQNKHVGDLLGQPAGSLSCVVAASREDEGVNVKIIYALTSTNFLGDPVPICQGKAKTGSDGMVDFICDLGPEHFQLFLPDPNDFFIVDGIVNVKGKRKVDCLASACVVSLCNNEGICHDEEIAAGLADSLEILNVCFVPGPGPGQ